MRPAVAIVFALAGYLALIVFGFGLVSLVGDTDVIAAAGFGVLPGVVGVAGAVLALAGVLTAALRMPHPSYYAALWGAAAAYLGYLAGVWVPAVAGGIDPVLAAAVVGRLAIGWWGLIVALGAFVSAWAAVALRRTHARRPRWPWERDAD